MTITLQKVAQHLSLDPNMIIKKSNHIDFFLETKFEEGYGVVTYPNFLSFLS